MEGNKVTTSIQLSPQSLRVINKNNIDINIFIEDVLCAVQENKLESLNAIFNKHIHLSTTGLGTEDILKRYLQEFFNEKNGDLTAFFSFALGIGYARAERVLNGLFAEAYITRAAGLKLRTSK